MEAPVIQINPDVKKTFLEESATIGLFGGIFVFALIYLNSIVGLDVFLDIFKDIGIEISVPAIGMWMLIIFSLIAVLFLITTYVSLHKIHYLFYADKLTYTQATFPLYQEQNKELSYSNVSAVSLEKHNFPKSSRIILHLTGSDQTIVALDHISEPADLVNKIQAILHEFKARFYAQYGSQYRMQNIVEEL